MLIMLAIENIIIIIGCIKTYKFKIRLKEILKKNKLKIREIYRTGIISMLMLLMMSFNYNIDIIILKQLSSSYSVGLYSIAVNLANMLWLIPDAFKDVLFNKTSKNDSINEIVLSTKLNLYLNIIITIGFIILGKQFINFMYGKEFIEAYNSTVILFIGCMVMIIYKLIHPLYIALGKQTLIFNILLASVFINIILNYILIPKFDIIGAAIASVCSYTICGIVFLIIFCKQYNVQISRFFVFNNDEINMFKTLLRRKKEK